MKVFIKAFMVAMSLLFYCNFAIAKPMPYDIHYCFGEPNQNEYADVVVCFNLETTTKWAFGTTSWGMSGMAFNRVGGVLSFTGSVNNGKDENGVPSYFIHFISTLNQHIQEEPDVVPFYIIASNMVIEASRMTDKAPSNDRFNPYYVIGVSYRQNIMMNAHLVEGQCEVSPWLCWDVQTSNTPKKVVRYDERDLPFLPLFERDPIDVLLFEK